MEKVTNCVLALKDLCFTSYDYKLFKKPEGKQKLEVSHTMNYTKQSDGVQVEIETKVSCVDFMELTLHSVGTFEINENVIKEENDKERLLDFITKNNTVAIMYPYIRAHIMMLTSQPFIVPIMLQPIDVTDMISKATLVEE